MPNDTAWIASGNASWRDVLRHNAPGANCDVISDRHARTHDRPSSDPHVVPNDDGEGELLAT